MDLLKAHKILIVFTALLGFALMVWGIVHGVYRNEPDAYGMLFLGGMVWPVATIYLIKLFRNPPGHQPQPPHPQDPAGARRAAAPMRHPDLSRL